MATHSKEAQAQHMPREKSDLIAFAVLLDHQEGTLLATLKRFYFSVVAKHTHNTQHQYYLQTVAFT